MPQTKTKNGTHIITPHTFTMDVRFICPINTVPKRAHDAATKLFRLQLTVYKQFHQSIYNKPGRPWTR